MKSWMNLWFQHLSCSPILILRLLFGISLLQFFAHLSIRLVHHFHDLIGLILGYLQILAL